MRLNFSLSCMPARTYAVSSHRLVTHRHDWKYRLSSESEIVSVGLMNTLQNHSRQSQQTINIIIMINGNRSVFRREIIIPLSHLCPLLPLPLCLLILSSPFSFVFVCTPPCLTSFSFLLNLFIIYFSFAPPSPSCLNPIHPSKREYLSQGNFLRQPCASCHFFFFYSVPVTVCAATPLGCFTQKQSLGCHRGQRARFNQLSDHLSPLIPLSAHAPVYWFITVHFHHSIPVSVFLFFSP